MNQKTISSLNKYYSSLYSNILKNKSKIDNKSILISFFNFKSNVRYKLLSESAIPAYKMSKDILDELKNRNLIRATDTLDNYTITANGIWEIENREGTLDLSGFLNHIDKKLFNVYVDSNKPLNEKQKVIVFSMIVARAFSDKSTVDLNKNEDTTNAWKEITDQTYYKLRDLGIISNLKIESNDPLSLYGNSSADQPVSNLYRHTDKLPKLTKGIFKAPGGQKYFLDISNDANIFKEQLKYLFELIIGTSKISYSEIDEMYTFCCDIANKKNIYVFDPIKHIFSKSKYDEIMRDVLLFNEYGV